MRDVIYFLAMAETQYRPSETAGPMPNAKISVANPKVPPKVQPMLTTTISIKALTQAIGRLVIL